MHTQTITSVQRMHNVAGQLLANGGWQFTYASSAPPHVVLTRQFTTTPGWVHVLLLFITFFLWLPVMIVMACVEQPRVMRVIISVEATGQLMCRTYAGNGKLRREIPVAVGEVPTSRDLL